MGSFSLQKVWIIFDMKNSLGWLDKKAVKWDFFDGFLTNVQSGKNLFFKLLSPKNRILLPNF